LLEDGQRTVGSVVELEHDAPTPIGDTVTVRAEISEVDEAKIWFKLSATDSKGSIASGRHARFVVDNARFRSGLERHPGAASTGERDEIRYS
jgi:predicted thioesterase